jgi:predicted NBD/HSP70 family sugar kinase
VLVRGADGRAVPLTQLFGHLGLRHHDSTAIDVGRLLAALRASDGAVLARTLGGAVADVLDAVVALADPAFVVVGGSWGADAALLEELRRQVARHPRPVKLELPVAGDQPFLAGARAAAVQRLRADIITRSHDPQR